MIEMTLNLRCGTLKHAKIMKLIRVSLVPGKPASSKHD